MVVFKCLLVFLLVFYVKGTYCKPAYDEQAVAPGVWSRLWGWVTYLNPWGSAVDTIAAPTTIKHDANSVRIKNPPVDEARQFTATTIYGNSTAALISLSDESMENEETTTPIISVQNFQISTTTEQHSFDVKASTTVITSGQNNTTTLEKSAADSRDPKTLTPVESVQYNPTETEELVLERDTEPNLSTTLIDQDILPTTEEPAIDEPEEPKASTTPIVLDLINPITEGELVSEEPLEQEVSTMDKNTSLKSEVTNISFIPDTDNQTFVKELLESVTSIYVSAFETATVSEGPATDYSLEPEALTTAIAILYQNILTSREEPVAGQTLEPEVTTISIVPDTDTPITAEEPVQLETSTYVSVLDTPTVTEEPVTEHLSEPKLSTTPIAMDLDFLPNEPAMEQLFVFESPTTASALDNPTTEEPVADDPLAPETTTTDQRDQNNTTITNETATEKGELPLKMEVYTDKISTQSTRNEGALFSGLHESLIPTEPAVVKSEKDQESIKRSKPVSSKDEVSTERSEGSTEFLTDPYPDLAAAVTERDKESTERSGVSILSEPTIGQFSRGTAVTETDEEYFERSDTFIFSEPASDLYLDVAVTVSGRDEESRERSELSTLTETATDLNPDIVTVLDRDELSTVESKASILTETATDPYKQLEEVSVSTDIAPIPFLEAGNVVPIGVNEVSTNVNAAFTAVNEVEAIYADQDEFAAPRVSRSHSAGYRLSFDQFPFMFLFYAVYF